MHRVYERFRRLIRAFVVQRGHQTRDQLRIAAGREIEIALEIAGNENIHRRRNRLMERSAAIIAAGADEIRQHVIRI